MFVIVVVYCSNVLAFVIVIVIVLAFVIVLWLLSLFVCYCNAINCVPITFKSPTGMSLRSICKQMCALSAVVVHLWYIIHFSDMIISPQPKISPSCGLIIIIY